MYLSASSNRVHIYTGIYACVLWCIPFSVLYVYLYQSAELRECKNVKLNLARPSRHYLDIKRSYFSPYLHYSRLDTYILAPSITRLLFYTRADRRQTHGRIICRGCARCGGGRDGNKIGTTTTTTTMVSEATEPASQPGGSQASINSSEMYSCKQAWTSKNTHRRIYDVFVRKSRRIPNWCCCWKTCIIPCRSPGILNHD